MTLEMVAVSMAVELPGALGEEGCALCWEEDMGDATNVAENCPGKQKEDEEQETDGSSSYRSKHTHKNFLLRVFLYFGELK